MPRNTDNSRSGQRAKGWDRGPRGRDDYRLSVRGQLRKEPDINKIAHVVIAMALAQAEADAERDLAQRASAQVDSDTAPEALENEGETLMSPKPVVWRALVLPPVIGPEAARSALLGLASLAGQPRLILEARGRDGRVNWRIGADNHTTLGRACQVVTTHLPGAVATPPRTDEPVLPAGAKAATQLRAPRSRWLPLAARDVDTVTQALLAALSRAHGDETIRYQLILGARTHPQRPPQRTEPLKRELDARHRQAGFGCAIRVAASAADVPRAMSLVKGLGSAVKPLDSVGVQIRLVHASVRSITDVRTPLIWPLWLSIDDAVPLLAWPVSSDSKANLPGLPPRHPKALLATSAHPRNGTVFGDASVPSGTESRPIAQAVSDALKHRHVLGPTGVGKSTLLGNLALQDIDAGRGVVVIDPKGDLVTDLLARIPDERADDIVLLDPSSPRPVGLNPLHADDPELAADGIVAVFHSLYGDGLGPRSTDILHASVLTLARRGDASLPMVPLLLTNPGFRRSMTGSVSRADQLGLGAFWAGFEAMGDQERDAAIRPLLNKLRPIMLRPSLRAVFGQRHPAISLPEILGQRKILLVRLGKATIGPEASTLLGSLLVAQLWQAILGRTSQPASSRQPVMVTIDEVQDYLRLPGSLGDVLAQARGLGVGITAAHQHRAQLGRLIDDVDANTGTKIYFRLAPTDARATAHTMASSVLEPEDYTSLPAYQAYARLLVKDNPTPWVSLTTRPLPPPLCRAETRQHRSEARYGRDLGEIERDLITLPAPAGGVAREGNHPAQAAPPTRLGRRRPAPDPSPPPTVELPVAADKSGAVSTHPEHPRKQPPSERERSHP